MDQVFEAFVDKAGMVNYKKFIGWILDESSQIVNYQETADHKSNKEKSIVYDMRQSFVKAKDNPSPIKNVSRVTANEDKSFNYSVKEPSIKNSEHLQRSKLSEKQRTSEPQTFDDVI